MNIFSIEFLVIVLTVLVALLIVLYILNAITLNKIKSRVNRFFGERAGLRDVETMLTEYLEYNKELDERFNQMSDQLDSINIRLAKCIQKVGLVRYNPFEEMGGDLSYALALLDENYDGLLINGVHARDYCHTYAKSITALNSHLPLSKEEKQALTLAASERDNK